MFFLQIPKAVPKAEVCDVTMFEKEILPVSKKIYP